MKKVYKYPTGAEIPEGAIYLSTQVEKHIIRFNRGLEVISQEHNKLVWHYFLVEVIE